MAELKFTAASAKDTDNLNADTLLASKNDVTLDTKKGVVSVAEGSTLEADSTIDVSDSAYFKTVSVASGYADAVDIEGNGTVANTFYAGGGGSTMFGGSGHVDESAAKPKLVTQADKFYGGAGADVFVYEALGGKDQIYNYGEGDVVRIVLKEGQTASYADKSGGLTITLSEDTISSVASNSVLTIDGKTASAVGGKFNIELVDSTGEVTDSFTYGNTVAGALTYAVNTKGKVDATSLEVSDVSALDNNTIESAFISSGIKNITVTDSKKAAYVIGNGNANAITIGAAGGTIDGGYAYNAAKGTYAATADKLYGNVSKPVTFVFDAEYGGKDQIGDAKLTAYNYKAGDYISVTGSVSETNLSAKGTDVMVSLNSANILTIKNGLGKPINVVDEKGTSIVEDWGDTLATGLNYDSDKMTKITADDSVITANEPTSSRSEYVQVGTDPDDGEPLYKMKTIAVYETITLDGDASYADSVKEIDLSTSSAPVIIDTSAHSLAAAVKVGKDGGTVTGYANDYVAQTFTAGNGKDLFIINVDKVSAPAEDADAAVTKAYKSFKGDVINGYGAGDVISLVGFDSETSLTATESGKDLVVKVDGTTLLTVKNYDSDTGVTLQGEDGYSKEFGVPAMPAGLSFADKKGKVDKTGIVAGSFASGDSSLHGQAGDFSGTEISAEDYGGAAIKTIDATAVTESSELYIVGSSAANNISVPTSYVETTVNGGTGNDNLYGSNGDDAEKVTFVFEAQDKGKKDVIYNYKKGDVIVFAQADDQTLYTAPDFTTVEETGDFLYDKTGAKLNKSTGEYEYADNVTGGFNDTKADVVITFNKSNTITVKNAAGTPIQIQNGEEGGIYTLGHIIDDNLSYDTKNTAVTLKSGATYKGDVDLLDTKTYYSTIKKVDLSGNTAAANIYGNTLANEFVAGNGGGILDGGSIYDEDGELIDSKAKPTADKITGGNGNDTFVYDIAYGKDSFLQFGEGDVVSLGASITAENLSITDKNNVLTVSIIDPDGELFETVKGSAKTAANSTFTVTKTSSNVAVKFVGDDMGSSGFTYGSLPGSGVSYGTNAKGADDYTVLNVSTDDAVTVDASIINSNVKTINASTSGGEVVLVGNANADALYAGTGGSTLFGGTAGTKAVKDQLYGGDGTDYFVFTSQGGEKAAETDIVYDYRAGDVIVLDEAPTSVTANGTTLTLKWVEVVEQANGKPKDITSTLTINGAVSYNDKGKASYGAINSSVEVTFAIGDIFDEDGNFDLSGAIGEDGETVTYKFAIADSKDKSETAAALKKGVAWDEISSYVVTEDEDGGEEESDSEQFAAVDGWLDGVTSTDNASVSELDSILKVNAITDGGISALEGDAYFTNTGFDTKAAALASARHQAKK